MQLAPTWSKRSKSIFLSETNHDSLQVSNWGTDEKQVNTFLFKNHLQNRYIGEFLNSLIVSQIKSQKVFALPPAHQAGGNHIFQGSCLMY